MRIFRGFSPTGLSQAINAVVFSPQNWTSLRGEGHLTKMCECFPTQLSILGQVGKFNFSHDKIKLVEISKFCNIISSEASGLHLKSPICPLEYYQTLSGALR